jgi:hypothetical protein
LRADLRRNPVDPAHCLASGAAAPDRARRRVQVAAPVFRGTAEPTVCDSIATFDGCACPFRSPDLDHRIDAIGDVHGWLDLFDRLRADAAAHDDDRQPVLVFPGDLVDRSDRTREMRDLAL